MLVSDVPMPAAVAARPRDARGIPVPAITRWQQGVPQFTEASGERQLLCALTHRCSVCGQPMDPDASVWHVMDGQSSKWIAYALKRGAEPAGEFSTYEVPGHYACMLYAAVACPFLATPTARRTVTGDKPGDPDWVSPGTRRGAVSGLVEFTDAVVDVGDDYSGYEIVLSRPRTIHTYHHGSQLRPLLDQTVAQQTTHSGGDQGAALLFGPDEDLVVRELNRLLESRRIRPVGTGNP